MQVGKRHHVVVRWLIEPHASPEAAHQVVGQIVEHPVQPVAPKRHLVARLAQALQPSVDVDARPVMEVECGAGSQGQRGPSLNRQLAIHNNRLLARQHGVLGNVQIGIFRGIPRPGVQVHLLFPTAFQQEHQVILHQLWRLLSVARRSQFHEHPQTVALPYFNPTGLVARVTAQIHPVHVHPESTLVAPFQSYACASQTFTVVIMHPETLRDRGHSREQRIHFHRICRKPQSVRLRHAERLVVFTSGEHQQSHYP